MSAYSNAATTAVSLADVTLLSALFFRIAGDEGRLANTVAFVEAAYQPADREIALHRLKRRIERARGSSERWLAACEVLLAARGWDDWVTALELTTPPGRLDRVPAPMGARRPRARRLTPAVVAHLNGGLGNQVFQYAAALRYARATGGDVRIFARAYRNPRNIRQFLLPRLRFELRTAGRLHRVRARRHMIRGWAAYSQEDSIEPSGSAWIGGTWENPGFFEGIEGELDAALQARDPAVLGRALAAVERVRPRPGMPVVAIHMRRGDRAAGAASARFPAIPASYFLEAARLFGAGTTFLVFSDTPADIELCRQELSNLEAVLHPAAGVDPIEDLHAIAACDHLILSAGTFSWWAGWLNRNSAKRVIAPDPLRGGGPLSASGGGGAPALPHWQVLLVEPLGLIFRTYAAAVHALPSTDG